MSAMNNNSQPMPAEISLAEVAQMLGLRDIEIFTLKKRLVALQEELLARTEAKVPMQ